MKPSKSVSDIITSAEGFVQARKAAADNIRRSRLWARHRVDYAIECAMRAGWWKRTAEEWNLEMMKAWA